MEEPRFTTAAVAEALRLVNGDAAASEEDWVAWEPAEWVAARGASQLLESRHFCVRWGSEPAADVEPRRIAEDMLPWLERFWSQLCRRESEAFFVVPVSRS